MVLCVVVGCSSKSGKHKGIGFFRIPKVITNQGEEHEELTARRRNEWISAVSRGDATNKRVGTLSKDDDDGSETVVEK